MSILGSLMDAGKFLWQNVDKIAFGTAAAGTVYGMFQDPYEDARRVLEQQVAEEQAALKQWRQQQEELFKYQLQDAQSTQQLQDQFRNQFSDILSGSTNIADSPMFSPQFATLRNQRAQALRYVEENFPQGGARERAIRSVMAQYADREAQLAGQIQSTIFNLASKLQMPYGNVGPAAPPTSGAVGALQQINQAQGFDPTAFFQIAKGYRELGFGEKPEPTPKPKEQPTLLNDLTFTG